jgi:hypothetical protein
LSERSRNFGSPFPPISASQFVSIDWRLANHIEAFPVTTVWVCPLAKWLMVRDYS